MLGEEKLNFLGITIYSACLFVTMLLCHYIPKWTHMGKKGEEWMIIIFFGILIGVAFNITIPGSLLVVTEAFEDYSNSTDADSLFRLLDSARRLDDGDDDDDDAGVAGGSGEGEDLPDNDISQYSTGDDDPADSD